MGYLQNLYASIASKENIIKKIIFGFPILSVFIFLLIRINWNSLYIAMIQEDAWIETTEAIIYGISSLFLIIIGYRYPTKKNRIKVIIFFFAIFFLFVCLEEISWGQRVFSITTPHWFEINNTQAEISIHNLKPVQKILHTMYMITSSLLAFTWIGKHYLIDGNNHLRTDTTLLDMIPEWYYMSYFLPTLIIYTYFLLAPLLSKLLDNDIALVGNLISWRDQEPAELLLSIGCFLVIFRTFLNDQFIKQTNLAS